MGIAADLVLLIIIGMVMGYIAHRLRLPPIIGYILAGVIVGPTSGIAAVSEVAQIETLAEIGVALLLFSLGLELKFGDLRAVRGVALIGTPIQLTLTGLYGYGIGHFLGWETIPAIWFGAVLSLSSTMVVLKTLMSQGLMATLSSRVMLGMLVVQDLAAIPMMIVLPELGNLRAGLPALGMLALKATVFIAALVLIGTRVLPFILRNLSRLLSRELFFLGVTAIALGVGLATHEFGLSFAFGAFVAGMVVSESEYSHQALSDILPLRDLFGLIFFASVGMLIDLKLMAREIDTILLLVVLSMTGKALVFGVITRVFGYRNIVPLAAGFGLAQIGEFSFVLLRLALKNNVFDRDTYSTILTASVITMLLAPLTARIAVPLYALRRRFFPTPMPTLQNPAAGGTRDHVIVAGGGRVGAQIADALKRMDLPFVVIEGTHMNYEDLRDRGLPVLFGDAGQAPVMEAAGIHHARLLIIAVPIADTVRAVVNVARTENKDLHIVARAADTEHLQELAGQGIYEVVQPEFEAGLEMIRQALLHLKLPSSDIDGAIETIRHELTGEKPDPGADNVLHRMRGLIGLADLHWVVLESGSIAAGKSLVELNVRRNTGLSITAVKREGEIIAGPGGDFTLREGDALAVLGPSEGLDKLRGILHAD